MTDKLSIKEQGEAKADSSERSETNTRSAQDISAEHANQQGPKQESPIKSDKDTIQRFVQKALDGAPAAAENVAAKDPERQKIDENRKIFSEAASEGRLLKLKPKGEVSAYEFTGKESPEQLEKLGVTAKQSDKGTEYFLQTTESIEKGQKIEPGNIILTRTKNGEPVKYEDYRGSGKDVVDRWANKTWDKFDGKYDRTGTQADGTVTAKVKGNAPEVWAVVLNKDTEVKTSWGNLQGGELAQSRGVVDLMTNYNYDPKASVDNLKANSDFAIVKGSEQPGNNAIDLGYEPAKGFEQKWEDLKSELRASASDRGNGRSRSNERVGSLMERLKQVTPNVESVQTKGPATRDLVTSAKAVSEFVNETETAKTVESESIQEKSASKPRAERLHEMADGTAKTFGKISAGIIGGGMLALTVYEAMKPENQKRVDDLERSKVSNKK